MSTRKKYGVSNISNNKDRKVVKLNTKAGIKEVLKALSTKDAQSQQSKYIKDKVKRLLDDLDENYKSEQYQKEVYRFLGINKDGSIGKRKKALTIRRGNNGNYVAVVARNRRRKVKNRNTFKSVGDIMLHWDDIQEILNEYGVLNHLTEFYMGTYDGWAERVMKQIGLETNVPSFLEWLRILSERYGKLYQYLAPRDIIRAYLTDQEIKYIIGNKSLDDCNDSEISELLSIIFKKL